MNRANALVGIFVAVGLALFTAGLFLIGNQHQAFRRHLEFYTEFASVDGITLGTKVRVAGMSAGQVENIEIPSDPASKFRIELQIDDRLQGLIRHDSLVTIETEGLVGDKFLSIHKGNPRLPIAPAKSTLRSKPPFEVSKLFEQASDLVSQVDSTMTEVRGELGGALEALTATINTTNGLVTAMHQGQGAAGVLLEDEETAANVKQIVLNGRRATANLVEASAQVNGLLTDFRSRQLFAKAERTLATADGAVEQINRASQQVNRTLTQALAEDQYGETAGSNLQQSFSNLNRATANAVEDTEALKQQFFFRAFFKKRGYDDLDGLPEIPYRQGNFFAKLSQRREWLPASALFRSDASGKEILSPEGRNRIDQAVGRLASPYSTPIMLEGYAQAESAADELVVSRARAVTLRTYLEVHFHIDRKNIGVIALSHTPPLTAGKETWDGVCLVQLSTAR